MRTTISRIGTSVSKFIKSESFGRLAMVALFITISVFGMYAAGDADPFVTANGTIERYIPSVKKLLYTIAAIIALVGAFNVYHKMTNGDQDVKKTIMLTLGGCIAMLALSEALPAFFGK